MTVAARLSNKYTTRTLLAEIGQGADRIIEITRILTRRLPWAVAIHEGLDDTL
jgi:hypothetical protein